MNSLRITHVLWSLDRAGAERVVLDLARACVERGHRVRVIAPGGGGQMEAAFRALPIDVCVAPHGLSRFALRTWMYRTMREQPVDIVHTHLGGDIWGMLGCLGLSARRIVTAHNDDQDEPLHIRWARRLALRTAAHVVCVSERVREHVRERFGVPAHRLSVIHNGLALPDTPPHPRAWHDTPRLLCVGRLVQQKGHDVLLRALAHVSQPWELWIAGDGLERQALHDQAKLLGIAPRVHFLGNVANVEDLYRDADLFAFPSRWEGQGLAMLEAMRAGLPVIASDLPVFHETFDEASCLFAAADDVPAWTHALLDALAHPERMHAQIVPAFIQLQNWFLLDDMVDAYLALYNHG